MKFSHLARYFYEWGWQIKHDHYVAFADYLTYMLKKNRVIIIEKDGQVQGFICFYLTNNYEDLYKKSTWEIVEEDPDGTQIYIDKMVCKKFTKELRQSIKEAIEERFPQVELGVYHRAPKDRCHKIYTRRVHV